ncbi:hypothetical protein NL676_008424 [Syzygium grande]|nr:hypothetical protein NL676_008424 [Syzygium grande]
MYEASDQLLAYNRESENYRSLDDFGHRIFAKDTCEGISTAGMQFQGSFPDAFLFYFKKDTLMTLNLLRIIFPSKYLTSLFLTILLCIPPGHCCVDLALYEEHQIIMLLNKMNDTRTTCANNWGLYQLKDPILHLEMENEKLRGIPHTVVPPLSVSASKGVACVLAARMQALVYILDEDEDEISDSE